MKILLTGSAGYIAQSLLPILLSKGHEIFCCVRDKERFDYKNYSAQNLKVIEVDFLSYETLHLIPDDIDVAYYLIHSMSTKKGDFAKMEELCAIHFKRRIEQTNAKQVIYLSGINNSIKLSKHLFSRKNVEKILSGSHFALTTLNAGIVIGSGSASFEIIRDLVEKLPIMIGPRWLKTKSQPIAIQNVIDFLIGVIGKPETYSKSYDIGGPDVLSYKEILLLYAKVRGLKRRIIVVPLMTPKISSYWLYFITSTSFALASNLVNSLKVEVVCKPNNLAQILGIELIDCERAIKLALDKIEQTPRLTNGQDAETIEIFKNGLSEFIAIPVNGCFKDIRSRKVICESSALNKIWSIGGENGWYYGTWLWEIRGLLDLIIGGVGMRRSRKRSGELKPGDSLDFWRVLVADKKEKRLLLCAEMKVPGEAWLEFKIDNYQTLMQVATFRPRGILGRLYWYALLPLHKLIFNGMISKIAHARI